MFSLLVFLTIILQLLPAVNGGRSRHTLRPRRAPRKPLLWGRSDGKDEVIAPKLFIINMFAPEGDTFLSQESLGLTANNVTVPGFSPLFPEAHCSESGDLCELITGEAEINAASTMTALVLSPLFNLTQTYFFIAGIAGINPECASAGSIAFSRYAVQFALSYEMDPRDISTNYSTGYVPFGTDAPGEYPSSIYGTEAFELNKDLQERAIALATNALPFADSELAQTYRAKYTQAGSAQVAGTLPPTVIAGDTVTSDVWFSGKTLGEAVTNFTSLVTNGTGRYCMTAEEDNASLEALLRANLAGKVDFSRIMLLRAASDVDRPPPGVSTMQNLWYESSGGFSLSLENMAKAGMEVINDIMTNWDSLYEKGITPSNYVGDIFDSLNGTIKPDYGSPAAYGNGSLGING